MGIAGGALLLRRLLLWCTTAAAADGDYWPDTAEETRSGGLRGNTSVGRLHLSLKANTLLGRLTKRHSTENCSGEKIAV